jgi:hypothetical protein
MFSLLMQVSQNDSLRAFISGDLSLVEFITDYKPKSTHFGVSFSAGCKAIIVNWVNDLDHLLVFRWRSIPVKCIL